ncbi:cation diffusion facilitator family transporter [Candidatus Roizmanbacteria bacterium]|nr:cation diffusion facilitator family transporter [Candidatus Roizmanbacteria bacterium]
MNKDKSEEPEPPQHISSTRVILTSFLVDVSDVIINLVTAFVSGSIVVWAEFLQGAADFIASGFLLVGIRRSRIEPDKKHPFGHGKELYFWTLLSAIVMVTVAASFSIYFGIRRIFNPEQITNIPLALGVLLFATITNGYALSLSLRRLMGSQEVGNLWQVFWHSPHVETKNAFVQDLMGTSSACVGLISLTLYLTTGITAFDGIGATLVGVILAVLAVSLIHGLHDLVIGRSAPKKVEEKIRSTVLSVPEVVEILDLRTMIVGSDKFLVNIEVHMQDQLTTDQLEKLIDKIKDEVQGDIPSISHIQVELESPEG